MAQKSGAFTSFLLQLATGVYFAVSGIQGIIAYDSELARVGRAISGVFGANSPMGLIVSIALLIAGALLVVGLFLSLKKGAQLLIGIVLMVLWGLNILNSYILTNFGEPSVFAWLSAFSRDLVILAVLWVIANRKEA